MPIASRVMTVKKATKPKVSATKNKKASAEDKKKVVGCGIDAALVDDEPVVTPKVVSKKAAPKKVENSKKAAPKKRGGAGRKTYKNDPEKKKKWQAQRQTRLTWAWKWTASPGFTCRSSRPYWRNVDGLQSVIAVAGKVGEKTKKTVMFTPPQAIGKPLPEETKLRAEDMMQEWMDAHGGAAKVVSTRRACWDMMWHYDPDIAIASAKPFWSVEACPIRGKKEIVICMTRSRSTPNRRLKRKFCPPQSKDKPLTPEDRKHAEALMEEYMIAHGWEKEYHEKKAAQVRRICQVKGCHRVWYKDNKTCREHSDEVIEKVQCRHVGCNTLVNVTNKGANYCRVHGGQKCEVEGCTKLRCSKFKFCREHGGFKQCKIEGCVAAARDSKSGLCIMHGGGSRCVIEGCTNAAVCGKFCRRHNVVV